MSKMKRKKQLLLMSLTALLVIGFGYGIYSVVPQLLAGDTQITDLTLKSQVNDQTIQLMVSDQNQTDTKVVVPLTDKLSYTPTKQANAGVTYDQVNHQIVIDWLTNHPKMVNLTVKAAQAGTYVFKAQTTRNDAPVNTNPIAATIKPVENTPTSSVLSDNQTSLSEKVAVPGLQEPDTTSSQSLNTKQATQQQKSSNRDLPAHADTDIVTPADLGNQDWLLDYLEKIYSIYVRNGQATFGDLKKVNSISYTEVYNPMASSGEIPEGIQYFTNLQNFSVDGNRLIITSGFQNLLKNKSTLTNVILKNTNEMTGSDIKIFFECKKLVELDLSKDHLKGRLPIELGNLKELKKLNLGDNEFEGDISDFFQALSLNMEKIDIRGNHKLFGMIPPSRDYSSTDIYVNDTQVVTLNPQTFSFFIVGGFTKWGDKDGKTLTKYINPKYKGGAGEISFTNKLVSGDDYFQPFENLGAGNMGEFDLGIGSSLPDSGDKTPLLPDHTFQITDSTGKMIYDGPADPSFKIYPGWKNKQYDIHMDHTQENFKKSSVAAIRVNLDSRLPVTESTLDAEDTHVGYNSKINYVKNKPFKMISKLKNNDKLGVDIQIGGINETIKAAYRDKVVIDPASFEIKKPDTTTWEAISTSNIQEISGGYQVNVNDFKLSAGQKADLRYSVMAKETFNDTAVLNQQVLLNNGDIISDLSNDMTIKNGELIFKSVPATMSFADSKIANLTTEIKRKLPDWKMQIEDSRVNKTDWHITANLISELQNSNGDSLGDSVVFKKTGQPNQVINTTSAVDVYDGKAGTTDYQDVQWGADAGPTLSVAPGLAKLGSYTGTMQWTLVDAPA
ncbi:leucine-rich repeat domain-containing protein [Latilactobacillus sakei]|uniref:leucine-rich repeat domain-containing protein n=1 Tax=Latilactobacillus sakei TaxID=1599 RepID=UPI002073096F|nr:hypothetical protein [Latilactobacillus sakei]USG02045.1 hypothetical protein A4W86_03085 [Latilactobacillus sakei]